ncbi:hypothetical protein [uncultured Sneathiella sp.]|uniref:hypothetical protein n=1 Tax=uncultured Sneathiella sp. TaxID=879315 RepID=UPI00259753FD|nr:hypothetical protein [uncultured Sneathiella sp.]
MDRIRRLFKDYETSAFFLIVVQPVFYLPLRLTESLDQRRIFFMFYALFGCALVAWASSLFSGPLPVYTIEHAMLYDFDDTAFQRRIYMLYAFVLFITALIGAIFRWDPSFNYFSGFREEHQLLIQTLVAVMILFLAIPLIYNYLGSITEKRAFWAVLGSLLLFAFLLRCTTSTRGVWILAIFTLIVFCLFFLLPLNATLVVQKDYLWGLDHHWTGVIGNGLLANIFPTVSAPVLPEYGIYLNKLVSAVSGITLFAGFGGMMKFLQAVNILFALLLLIILTQRFGTRHMPLAILSFLLVIFIMAPTLSSASSTLKVPNQATLRFIFIPVALMFVPLMARGPVSIWWVAAGILGAVAAAYNLETGLVVMLGLGFALFIRSMGKGYLTVIVGGALFIVAFLGTAYLAIISAVNGQFDLADMSSLLNLFAAGYGGKEFYWYAPFFIIMAHVFYHFFDWLRCSREGRVFTGTDFQSIAIVGMIIAFMPYVTNRFYVQNMWVPYLLYLLLILPMLTDKSFLGKALLLLFVIGVLAPSHLEQSTLFVKNIKRTWTLQPSETCLNGFTAPKEVCDYAEGQATELRSRSQNGDTIWISATPLTIATLSGIAPSLSRADPFAYARTSAFQRALRDEITAKAPDLILIDRVDILNPLGIPAAVGDWQKRLVEETGYRITGKSDFWLYARKGD